METRLRLRNIVVVVAVILLSVTQASAQRTYGGSYTKERIANLRKNCSAYDWAKKEKSDAVADAEYWIHIPDQELWAMVPGQDLPRCIDVTLDRANTKTKPTGCLQCGSKIFKFGNYPYNPDIREQSWKLTCPSCQAVFPTNDFGKYYKSGIDERGLFNPAKADRSLLFNTAHPDPADPLHKFGVDDGFGYTDKNGRANRFIGYYVYKYWAHIFSGITALADAYLYTGNQVYSRKAAILLDRVADVYPDMDWKPYADKGWYHSDGGGNMGKIGGSIWETGTVQLFADAYDKILSGTENDPALFAFLKQQAQKYKLSRDKGSRKLLVENIDDGILRTGFKAVLSKQVRGNQGMHQLTVAACAIALNTEPETSEWLDWMFKADGGDIPGFMIAQQDHDGSNEEGAPGYTSIWGNEITRLAVLLDRYPAYTRHTIFGEFPHAGSLFLTNYRLGVLGRATPNIGDAGATGLAKVMNLNPRFMAQGYYFTRNPEIAIAAYRANKNSAKGLGLDIFAEDPEKLSKEIAQIAGKAGPRPQGSYLMSGFGLAVLEAGRGSSAIGLASNYGRTIKHAHPDMLNFDLFAFNAWLAPDHGYPEFATRWPSNGEWTGSTLSHNTVFVDQRPQKEIWSGNVKLFKQAKGIGVFEIDGKKAYPQLKTYSRTMFLVGGKETADSNAYVIDIVRVDGGNDYVYSFHGPPGDITPTALNLVSQDGGTYAGKDVEKGAWAKGFPIGYSHLYNVKSDKQPPSQFMLDWKAEAGYRGLREEDGVHLRFHSLTQADDVSLADGDPPQNKPGNPRKLGYLLMHNAGDSLLKNYVSVIEPYRKTPFIKLATRLDDGKSDYIAIKVEFVNGTSDVVIYNIATAKSVTLKNGISMKGAIGYVREKKGESPTGVLINGSALTYKKLKISSAGAITGKVLSMNKGLSGGGWIIVDAILPVNGSLVGEQIMIDSQSDRDACYTISAVESAGNGKSKVICGPISFVRGFAKPRQEGLENSYLYDFDEGSGFKISSHAESGQRQKNAN